MPPGNCAEACSHCLPSNPENDPSVCHSSARTRSVSGTWCQVAPSSVDASSAPISLDSVSYQRSKDSRAPPAGGARLSFDLWYDTESSDIGALEASTDDGATWHQMPLTLRVRADIARLGVVPEVEGQ